MSEEEQVEATVSEQAEIQPQDASQEPRMVPLAALEAERRKRQEAEAKSQVYQEYMMRAKEEAKQPEPEQDPEALVERKVLQQETAMTKREILEQVYQDMNPEGVQRINKYLQPILEKKKWLAETIDNATNRYARAHEIVMDYMHLVEEKPAQKQISTATEDAKRIVQNAMKPGSPVNVGKSQNPGGAEYLKSIQGKREFREYRQKLLRG